MLSLVNRDEVAGSLMYRVADIPDDADVPWPMKSAGEPLVPG
jgi:hypothetical protein